MSFANRALPHRDGYRLAPNCLLRCGLFGAIPPWQARTECTKDKPVRIATPRGVAASQSQGERMDQADLDVLFALFSEFALCEYLDDKPIPSIDVPIAGLLLASGRQDGGKNRAWLHQSLKRLGEAKISLENNDDELKIKISNQALVAVTKVTETRYKIELPTEIRCLFDVGFAGVDWHERQQLSHLGKWLHAFYSSHRQSSYRLGARLLGQLSGRSGQSGDMAAAFPKVLAKELKSLADISGWRCEIDPKSERVSIEKQTDGVGGNASTAEGYRDHDFSADGTLPGGTESESDQADTAN